ncbi:unnamed protein product [Auanema sp. JU1783]|nr:unnamed protein product [Auanema sp. JU1783]
MSGNRRKNNVKAASSAKAAELLSMSGHSVSFLGIDGSLAAQSQESNDFEPGSELDPELIVIFKKMAKKDPQTREKALREISSVFLLKDLTEKKASYDYFATIFDKLSLDSSPSVRSLSIKVLSLFISELKKYAEKKLDKVIPFVLFATCDSLTNVGNSADSLLENCFSNKLDKITQLFSKDAANVSISLLRQKSPLAIPQKFDEGENSKQRTHRLVVQSTRFLAKLVEQASVQQDIIQCVNELLKDNNYISTMLKGNAQLQNSFIRLCTMSKDFEQNVLDSVLVNYVISNLDNELLGKSCFELLLSLIQNENFGDKVDVRKQVIPKLLFVIRRKTCATYNCFHYYLPIVISINKLISDEEKEMFSIKVLESYIENMPFESSALISPWSISFCESARYVLKKFPNSECITSIFDIVNNAIEWSHEDPSAREEILRLVVELGVYPQFGPFSRNLQYNLINTLPRSEPFVVDLINLCEQSFLEVHLSMLNLPTATPQYYKGLRNCTDSYLERISVDRKSFVNAIYSLSLTCKDNLEGVIILSEVLTRIASLYSVLPDKFMSGENGKMKSLTDIELWTLVAVCRLSQPEYEKCKKLLNKCKPNVYNCLSRLGLLLFENNKLEELDIIIEKLNVAEKDLLFVRLCKSSRGSFKYLSDCLSSCNLSEKTRDKLWEHVFKSTYNNDVFECDETLDAVINSVANCDVILNKDLYLLKFLLESQNHGDARVLTKMFSSYGNTFNRTLCTEQLILSIIEVLDCHIYPQLLSVSAGIYSNLGGNNRKSWKKKMTTLSLLYSIARIVLNENSTNEQRDLFSCIVVIALPALSYIKKDHLERPEFHRYLEDVSMSDIENIDFTNVLARGLYSLLKFAPVNSLTVLQTLHSFPRVAANFKLTSDYNDLPKSIKHILHIPYNSDNEIDSLVMRYHSEFYDNPEEFMRVLHEASKLDCLQNLFCVIPEEGIMSLNLCALIAGRNCISSCTPENFEDYDQDILDFILCGVVTAMTSLGQQFVNDLPNTFAINSFFSLAFDLYTATTMLLRTLDTANMKTKALLAEWNQFHLPTICPFIYQFMGHANTFEQRAYFCRTSFVKALIETRVFPEYIERKEGYKCIPELELLGYSPTKQYLISVAVDCVLSKSSDKYMTFAGLHVLEMLCVEMYRQENPIWKELQADVGTKRKSNVPHALVTLLRAQTTACLVSIGALEVLLTILESFGDVNEERVAFCDAVRPFVSVFLEPYILFTQKEDAREPMKRVLYVNDKIHERSVIPVPTIVFNVLYRVFRSLPAMIRGWFASLSHQDRGRINPLFIKEAFSARLIDEELRHVVETARVMNQKQDNLKIKTIFLSREVVAEYTVDDTVMKLMIRLPADYPLNLAEVELEKSVVANERSKKWLLQLMSFLHYQNGPVIDGILIWRNNVDKDVEGSESCSICLMVVNSSSHQLPKARCRQCKNKFHSNCLYTWFQSSGKETCPLCRNHFLGSR